MPSATAAGRWALGAVAALMGVSALGLLVGPPGRLDPPTSESVAVAAGFVPVGLFLLRYRPASRTARLTWCVGALALLGLAAAAWSGTTAGAWLTQWSWWPPLALVPVLLLGFPDGSAGVRTRRLTGILLATGALSSALLAGAAALAPRSLLTDSEAPLPAACRPLLLGFAALAVLSVAGLVVALGVLLRRARSREGATRAQVLCLAPAAVLLPVGIGLDALDVPFALVPAVLALPAGIGVAILEHRLDDLDQVVRRGPLRVVLTLVVVALYAGVLLLVEPVARAGRPGVAAAFVLAGVAVLLDPVRRRLAGGVERLLYGRRDDPYAVLAGLGRRLAAVGAPDEMLRTTADAIVEALRLPRAQVSVDVDGRRVVVAESGRADTDAVTFPLTREGRDLGELAVWTRRRGEPLTAPETRLLEEVARQAAVAAQAHRLTLALQAARERLVLAREEERLRLRRDFHDGVGPVIAGARMQLHAALPLVGTEAEPAVGRVLTDLGDLGRSVREIVDGLRPAALDRGLEAALAHSARAVLTGREVTVEASGPLEQLPPAVEVAAFRIVTEAVHNVARHSDATECAVRLELDGDLRISVRDNGSGSVLSAGVGVGTASMRARAEELGGALNRTHDGRGTVLEASIPVSGLPADDGTSSR